MIAAVLRAIWGLSTAYDRAAPIDPVAPYGWETARSERRDVADRSGHDRPREIADLVEGGAIAGPPETPARLTVEIRPTATVADSGVATFPPRPDRAPSPRVDPGTLYLSQRVLLHLQRLGAHAANEVAPMGATQGGMTTALDTGQSSLTKVLTRLVAAGALTESRGHVEGAPRRLKVYRLTPLGESIARDLRHRTPGGVAPPSREPHSPRAG
ncbi:MAG TPA: hypothetical protein VMH90_01740 [Thermoplasmata archaeon]|nr:hypothetical protein [Thermoplasmata archaeon]